MNATDLIYREIYKGIISGGGRQNMAAQYAAIGVEDYKKNRNGRPMDVIKQRIRDGIKAGKKK